MKKQYIIMADMISSRTMTGKDAMKHFRKLVTEVNKKDTAQLLSPLTITLGDEFQGLSKSLAAAVQTLIHLEEKIIEQQFDFKLRYVIHYGEIDTPINRSIAYEMLGKGLTDARKMITDLKQQKHERFMISVDDPGVSESLTKTFFLFQSVYDHWKEQDYELVTLFLKQKDYKIVAEKTGKDVSLMWRREKSLQIKEYTYIKDLITYLSSSKK